MLRERLMRRDSVRAHADDFRAQIREKFEAVPESAGFPRATNGFVLRVEVQDHVFLVLELGKCYVLAFLRLECEVWSFVSDVNLHRSTTKAENAGLINA